MTRFQCYRMAESGIRWRLMGGNNRVLGVCVREHDDLASARAEVAVVRARAALAGFVIGHADDGSWWWRLAELARSAQGFARRVDAELAANRFGTRAVDAGLDPELALYRTGKRGRSSRGGSDVWRQRPVG
ncbi:MULTISPECIES: hypothetical protein [Actinosynnema]|uniref:hypothetical protein n=1 Tax=Actinosynnema TaxID=40566 RepID=UPI0020A2CB4B|nr:hypothetical protein [Actinosynnema pretiosum]MCP2092321.1 hypothetical protein [Actinosynnema pretiosum]